MKSLRTTVEFISLRNIFIQSYHTVWLYLNFIKKQLFASLVVRYLSYCRQSVRANVFKLILCRKCLFDVEQRLSNRTALRVVSFSGFIIVVSRVDLRIDLS